MPGGGGGGGVDESGNDEIFVGKKIKIGGGNNLLRWLSMKWANIITME